MVELTLHIHDFLIDLISLIGDTLCASCLSLLLP